MSRSCYLKALAMRGCRWQKLFRQSLLKVSWKTFISYLRVLECNKRNFLSSTTTSSNCLSSLVYFQIKTETMTETSLSRGESPPNSMNQDYDITRMREDDFERLAVYIVPDVPCERGLQGRAEKTLPRSLALKASLVLSVPNQPVRLSKLKSRLNVPKPLFRFRSRVFGALV